MNGVLTTEQRHAYVGDGFVFPVSIMSAGQAQQHCQRLVELEAEHGAMHYRVKPYLVSTAAHQVATNPPLLDAVESIIGPDILLWDGSYVIKEACDDRYVSWHQDLTYWGLEMQSDYDLVSVWVALTPATQENGCMRFVRGSHTQRSFSVLSCK